MLSRRALISTSALVSLGALAACSSLTKPSSPGTVPAQVITDVNGALIQLDNILPALAASNPPVIPPALEQTLLADVNYAFKALQMIGPNTPAQDGATILARVEGYGSAVLQVLLTVPLPPPYNVAVIAANVVWASLVAYLNTVIPQSGGQAPVESPVAAHARASHISIEEARRILKIPAAQ